MSAHYIDTSALMKRYLDEDGCLRVRNLLRGNASFFTASLTYAEVYATFARLHREGQISRSLLTTFAAIFESDWSKFSIIDFVAPVRALLPKLVLESPLRGADIVHLASAVMTATAEPELTFIASDQRLLHAATDHGLQTLDPTVG